MEDVINQLKKTLDEVDELTAEQYSLGQEIIDAEMQYNEYEQKLWLETDFKKVGASNKELREMYVANQLKDVTPRLKELKSTYSNNKLRIKFLFKKIDVLREFGQ